MGKKKFKVETKWFNVPKHHFAYLITADLKECGIEVGDPNFAFKNSIVGYDLWWRPKNNEEYNIGCEIKQKHLSGW